MDLKLLEKRMAELNLNPIDVAAQTGVALKTVLRILNGQSKKPQPLTVRALAKLLRVPEDQLYTGPPRKRAG